MSKLHERQSVWHEKHWQKWLGHIFSGSSIVDQENVAGYGTGTILAFYTSASDKNGQIQCLAYSNDNGRTFTKYDKNPILRSSDRRKDFRDPKVFWYAPGNKWIMIVAADKEIGRAHA